jgi:hypothetical protein
MGKGKLEIHRNTFGIIRFLHALDIFYFQAARMPIHVGASIEYAPNSDERFFWVFPACWQSISFISGKVDAKGVYKASIGVRHIHLAPCEQEGCSHTLEFGLKVRNTGLRVVLERDNTKCCTTAAKLVDSKLAEYNSAVGNTRA